MSLHEFGAGIYRTHVTWEEVQQQCQMVFGERARFGPERKITSIGDGRGFLSKMCLIEPDFPADLAAPSKFVLKICTQVTWREFIESLPSSGFKDLKVLEERTESIKKGHNTECLAYELLDRVGGGKLRYPRVYASSKFSEENPRKGYLLMEYIEGAVNINLYDNVSADDLKQAIREIAVLEAVSLRLPREELKPFDYSPFEELWKARFAKEAVDTTVAMFRKFAEPELKEKVDKFVEYLPDFTDIPSAMRIVEELGMPKVLVHGDVWSTNILWKRSQAGGFELAAIVDYQTAHLGMPAVDLVRLIASSLSGKDKKDHWERLTEEFYGILVEELEGEPVPYTLEQLKESIRRFFPVGAFLITPMIGPLFEMNNENLDEETRKKGRALILEKTEAMLDDMFFTADYNRRRRSEEN